MYWLWILCPHCSTISWNSFKTRLLLRLSSNCRRPSKPAEILRYHFKFWIFSFQSSIFEFLTSDHQFSVSNILLLIFNLWFFDFLFNFLIFYLLWSILIFFLSWMHLENAYSPHLLWSYSIELNALILSQKTSKMWLLSCDHSNREVSTIFA